jgi:hypothetical protein
MGETVYLDLAGATWKKSTRSAGNGQCVEVATVGDHVAVRDSKDIAMPPLVFSREAWVSFVTGVSAGDFDPR